MHLASHFIKFIHSEKATKFEEIYYSETESDFRKESFIFINTKREISSNFFGLLRIPHL